MQIVEGEVLETRKRGGLIYRRRRTASGSMWTVELPQTVLKTVSSASQLAAAVAAFERGQAVRARAKALRDAVEANIDVKPTALAHMLGCTEARIRQIRATIKR